MNERGNIELSYQFCTNYLQKEDYILDIGCSYGSLCHKLSNYGYKNVYGLDIKKETISEGRSKYPEIGNRLMCYDGSSLPFDCDYFDAVLMFDVIEHIPNINEYLKNEVHGVLKKQGVLIFQTPNKFTNIPWEIIKSRSLRYREYHCSLQSFRQLKHTIESSGFGELAFYKMPIYNERNKEKVKRVFGKPGLLALKIFDSFPKWASTNFWGVCYKLK